MVKKKVDGYKIMKTAQNLVKKFHGKNCNKKEKMATKSCKSLKTLSKLSNSIII